MPEQGTSASTRSKAFFHSSAGLRASAACVRMLRIPSLSAAVRSRSSLLGCRSQARISPLSSISWARRKVFPPGAAQASSAFIPGFGSAQSTGRAAAGSCTVTIPRRKACRSAARPSFRAKKPGRGGRGEKSAFSSVRTAEASSAVPRRRFTRRAVGGISLSAASRRRQSASPNRSSQSCVSHRGWLYRTARLSASPPWGRGVKGAEVSRRRMAFTTLAAAGFAKDLVISTAVSTAAEGGMRSRKANWYTAQRRIARTGLWRLPRT